MDSDARDRSGWKPDSRMTHGSMSRKRSADLLTDCDWSDLEVLTFASVNIAPGHAERLHLGKNLKGGRAVRVSAERWTKQGHLLALVQCELLRE